MPRHLPVARLLPTVARLLPIGQLERFVPAATERDAGEHRSEELRDRGGVSDIDVTEKEAEGEEAGDALERGLGHLRGRRVEREEKCGEGGVGAGAWRPGTGEAESYPWPSSSMPARKKMTCGFLMS